MQQLKKRFQKDPEFFNSYTKQTEELIFKRYATWSSSNSIKGKTWYLPHHGVKHVSKPDKVRIVFDCSTNYGRTSLSNKLISGPDLTNQPAGVLIRFHTKEVAFMGDTEAMHYQVQVPKEQRSVLGLLWWKDSDLGGDLLDHEMCEHVFGGTSSPGCCNYGLRKTAIGNKVRYGEDASKTLLQNFYVDDLLKLVETKESVVRLIRDVRAMCLAGGFNLTKFISNKKVIQSVPEYNRRNGVKNADLDTSLPLEKTLGVYWDTENIIFRFKIVLKDKPMTRRGMRWLISSISDPLGFVAPHTLRGKRILQLLCQDEIGWDEIAPDDIIREWHLWCKTLHSLEHDKISRCYNPVGLEK